MHRIIFRKLSNISRIDKKTVTASFSSFSNEVITALGPVEGGSYLDLTFGAGHHSKLLLETCDCKVLGLDCDPEVNSVLENVKSAYPTKFYPYIGTFSELPNIFDTDFFPPLPLSGIILDLGVSEFQMENNLRGFNLDKNGLLDLRMDPSTDITAGKILQHADKDSLARMFRIYGGVKKAKQVAADVVESRYLLKKMNTTEDLKNVLKTSHDNMEYFETETEGSDDEVGKNCVKVYEALRRFVNDEVNQIEFAITFAERVLEPGATLVVVTRSDIEERLLQKLVFKEIQQSNPDHPVKDPFIWTVEETQYLGQENQTLHVLRKVK